MSADILIQIATVVVPLFIGWLIPRKAPAPKPVDPNAPTPSVPAPTIPTSPSGPLADRPLLNIALQLLRERLAQRNQAKQEAEAKTLLSELTAELAEVKKQS